MLGAKTRMNSYDRIDPSQALGKGPNGKSVWSKLRSKIMERKESTDVINPEIVTNDIRSNNYRKHRVTNGRGDIGNL